MRGPGETHAEKQVHLSDHEIASHERFEERVAHGYPSPYEKDNVHMYSMRNNQFQLVYDCLSFSLACMMSTTVFLFLRLPSVTERYKSALIISGLVTFIAAYHYIRIFNSWVDAYAFPKAVYSQGCDKPDDLVKDAHIECFRVQFPQSPEITGVPFNDAYRY